MARSNRIKRERIDPATRKALELDLPTAQIAQGLYALRDVVNHDEQDQRAMVRNRANERDRGSNKGRQTVRRLTRIERLVKLQIIDRDQAAACQWYADAHELGFVASLGVTANYGATGGGGGQAPDHFAKNEAQRHARANYHFAREGIPEELRDLFDSVVMGSLGENEFRAVTRNEVLRIGIAAWRLHGQVSHLIAVAA